MKRFKILLTLFAIAIFFANCKKEQEKEECGCNGIIQFTIPKESPLDGVIGYKIQLDTLDNFYNDKYWLAYVEPNCDNCVHHFILCNDDILTSDLKSNILSGSTITVKFSGIVTETCQKIFAPADYTYNHIILTKIEQK